MAVAVPLDVQKLLGEATMSYAYRDFQGAVTKLLEVVRLCPRIPHPYETLGLIYEELGQKKKSLQLFLMAANLSKRDTMQWKHLAGLATEVGESEQALFCLGKVLSLDPDDVDALWEQARLHVELGQHRKAAGGLATLLQRRPRDVQVVHHLARCYLELGMRDRAVEMLTHVLGSLLRDEPPPEPPAAAAVGLTQRPSAAASRAASRAASPPATATASGAAGSAEVEESASECALHLTHMLLELLAEKGAWAEGLARVAALRSSSALPPGAELPLEIRILEGACCAYLGDVARAELLWRPLLGRTDGQGPSFSAAPLALDETDHLLYEVAKVYLAVSLPRPALAIYDRLLSSERYKSVVHLRRGECLAALRRDAEAATAYSQALAVDARSLGALLAACKLHLRSAEPAQVLRLLRAHRRGAAAEDQSEAGEEEEEEAGASGSSDVRLVALRGCALSDLGRHAEAVALLQPIQAVALRQLQPRTGRNKRGRGGELEGPPKRLRLSADGEITADGGGSLKRLRLSASGEILADDAAEEEALLSDGEEAEEEAEAGEEEEAEELSGAAAAAAAEGAAAVRQLSEGGGEVVGLLETALWTSLTIRLSHSLWASRGPAPAYRQLHRATALFLRPAKAAPARAVLEPEHLVTLRELEAKLACAVDEPLLAYDHVRALCHAAPRDASAWALFHFVVSRARHSRPDERWTLRLLLRQPDSAQITLAVAHRCLMARSFGMALGEYLTLFTRQPEQPLLALCIAACKLQTVMSRKNEHRGHSALIGVSWMKAYAALRRGEQPNEVAYNMGRAYHHMGLPHLAVPCYIEALLGAPADAGGYGQDVTMEAAYNLVHICRASGNHELAAQITRTFMVL